jgi:hypothetical protein
LLSLFFLHFLLQLPFLIFLVSHQSM